MRKVITVPLLVPPAPPEFSVSSYQFSENEYYVEKMAQVEMKIYPNPAREKITFEISGLVGVENIRPLQTGVLQLFTLNGQLLQTQPVSSSVTEVSMIGLAKGVYFLKVQINDSVEEWKIIKM